MNDKELYQQKMQARLDGWKADVDKLKAKRHVVMKNAAKYAAVRALEKGRP